MSVSFDHAADYYDATRGYPPGVVERICRALLDAAQATPATRFLEVGVGTGRIALPMMRAGYRYTGVDISTRMLDVLRQKLRADPARASSDLTLLAGDCCALPFAEHSFDVVLTVQVYPFVADRQRAVAESARVLTRPGILLNGYDDHLSLREETTIFEAWQHILVSLGWREPSPHERQHRHAVAASWRTLGARVDVSAPVEWETTPSPADLIETFARRQWAGTWAIPDDLFHAAISALRRWANTHYGALVERPGRHRHRFVIERGILSHAPWTPAIA
jgi:SAM-dependent methyltransferase